MASTHKANNLDRPVSAAMVNNVPVESFVSGGISANGSNGDLTINLNRAQWMFVTGALSIAAGESAIVGNYEQMFHYSGLCNSIGARLGVGTQSAGLNDLPPPQLRAQAAAI